MDKSIPGIREQIAHVATVTDVKFFQSIGSQYAYASPKTKRAWASTAARRLRQLEDMAGSFSPGVSVSVRNDSRSTGKTL